MTLAAREIGWGDGASVEHRTVQLTRASTIKPRPVRWLMDLWMALGSFVLCGGREGIGKSTVMYTLVGLITRGQMDGHYRGTPRAVIIAASEDSWEYTIVPRLMAANADLDLVYRVDVVTSETIETALTLPRDLPGLERAVNEVSAVLILLDPLLSRLDSKLDTHKDAQVRLALEPLVAIADRTSATVAGLIHVNKSDSSDPLTTLMASRAFAAVARSVLFVMVDPDNEQTRLLGLAKNNLGRCDLPTRAFSIEGCKVADTAEGEVWTGRVVWQGEQDRSIKDAIAATVEASGDRTATSEAGDWLQDYLAAHDGRAASKEIKDAGKAAGHSAAALKRAHHRLKLTTISAGFPRQTFWMQSAHTVGSRPGESVLTELTGPTEGQPAQWDQSAQSDQWDEGYEPTAILPGQSR